MEIGIVGLPNVGKSSLFNALTGAAAAAENFPFTTIEPNIGVVPLPDERLSMLAQEWSSAKVTPSGIRFVDIAGIVQGASQGEGLGNKFLAHIRSVDAIAHVVRCFKDENVVNVMSELDPRGASDIITTELLLADIQQCQGALDRWSKKAKSGDKDAINRCNALNDCMKAFNEGTPARQLKDIPPEIINEFQFLTAKSLMYVANTDEGEPDETLLKPLRERAAKEGAALVTLCTKLEAEIVQLPAEERSAYYEAAGIASPGLSRLAHAGKDLLKLICFFTAGPQETRAWLIPRGTPAVKAAGKIHTDIERGFIRAEIYKCEDLKKWGSYKAVQEKNLVTLEGKEYIMQDGDAAYFRFSV
ncbi:MAG: redox-regulated ATPase YchF [Candidatus Omnitrophica bacterium]|nr:redox-regulated ATPase YchF [Candidatus Omnitrophota bacterium]MDE2223485.1 redox-regulated ATPase YchF [Candidatus Omnitrophota bacterium]